MTDERLAKIEVSEKSLFPRHLDVLHQFADHMEQGTCHMWPGVYMTEAEFIQYVRAGDFDV